MCHTLEKNRLTDPVAETDVSAERPPSQQRPIISCIDYSFPSTCYAPASMMAYYITDSAWHVDSYYESRASTIQVFNHVYGIVV